MFRDINIEVSDTLYQSFTGQSTLNICKQLCLEYNLDKTPESLVNIKRKYFKYLFENDSDFKLIDGILNLIKDYHYNSLKLVLASSASMTTINNIFSRFNLDQYFVAKLSGADLKASKPHPEIFYKAAHASGFMTSVCMVLEDSTNGIRAAHEAGIYCVAFKSPNSKNQDYSLASMVINDFNDVSYAKISTTFKEK